MQRCDGPADVIRGELGAPAVRLHERMDQAEPQSRSLPARLAAVETLEQATGAGEVEPGPVVADRDRNAVGAASRFDRDGDAALAVAQRVLDQGGERAAQPFAVDR